MSRVETENTTVELQEGGKSVSLSLRLFKPLPDMEGPGKGWTVVLVHQYSVLGGCKALLKGMATCLAVKGFLSITFDMRGVKRSTGKSTLTGSSEVHDVVAVCNWAAKEYPDHRILLVGSSAGAPIAGSAVDKVENVVAYVGLGYPFGCLASILFSGHHRPILESTKPKLFVMGTKDGFTSVKQLENKLKSAAGRVETHLIPGVGHFEMEGPFYDDQMATLIADFSKTI
ncbi:hypothetical protein KP509_14G030600 [Ceratopteris richardii]|uniref:KANL3/Tex30 alpha/beta hydrolase-like domain-containing protein n=1 Tax=Ceratopteris richardii TaxID=49495 RepID=A0A8T2T907_CERRI|nr:hypothetical protein KP509_14G030600 [Ceratopteris richardii]